MKGVEIQHPESENPEALIRELMQEASMMGRNDREFSRFQEILGLLNRKECAPEEAIKMAREVRYGKQDY